MKRKPRPYAQKDKRWPPKFAVRMKDIETTEFRRACRKIGVRPCTRLRDLALADVKRMVA